MASGRDEQPLACVHACHAGSDCCGQADRLRWPLGGLSGTMPEQGRYYCQWPTLKGWLPPDCLAPFCTRSSGQSSSWAACLGL